MVFLGSHNWVGDRMQARSGLLQGLIPRQDRVLLWGQKTARSPDEWIELRIPHRLAWPVPDSVSRPGVQAVQELWEDGRGEVQFQRLCQLTSFEED